MILICDKTVSARSRKLRNAFFEAGYPCAVCDMKHIGDYLPIKLFVTFTDAFDDLRRTQYINIFALSLGVGFVNSALFAKRVLTTEELFEEVRKFMCEQYGITDERVFDYGFSPDNGVFFSPYFIEINSKPVILTKTSYMIFKYLYAFAGQKTALNPRKIYKFCYKTKIRVRQIPNNIAVNVNKINSRFRDAGIQPIIKARRGHGYYAEKIIL